jgi:hypothetical protein
VLAEETVERHRNNILALESASSEPANSGDAQRRADEAALD